MPYRGSRSPPPALTSSSMRMFFSFFPSVSLFRPYLSFQLSTCVFSSLSTYKTSFAFFSSFLESQRNGSVRDPEIRTDPHRLSSIEVSVTRDDFPSIFVVYETTRSWRHVLHIRRYFPFDVSYLPLVSTTFSEYRVLDPLKRLSMFVLQLEDLGEECSRCITSGRR